MTAKFIISFDCEGKWGLADQLSDYYRSALTNDNLNKTYQRLKDILNKWCIKGTFAFVGAFTMSRDEYEANKAMFSSSSDRVQLWLQNMNKDISRNIFDGWFNLKAFEIISAEPHHEIAGHGFTHILLNENYISKDDFLREIDNLKAIKAFRGRDRMTFVYPRNQIGYVQELKKAGFIGYRDGKIFHTGIFSKIKRGIAEFNIWQASQREAKFDEIISIPSGFFLILRQGIRKKIPIFITIKRWKNLIYDAIKYERIVHLYTHPYNFITGDRMFDVLDMILAIVQSAQKQNDIINVTQKEYVELILNKKGLG